MLRHSTATTERGLTLERDLAEVVLRQALVTEQSGNNGSRVDSCGQEQAQHLIMGTQGSHRQTEYRVTMRTTLTLAGSTGVQPACRHTPLNSGFTCMHACGRGHDALHTSCCIC